MVKYKLQTSGVFDTERNCFIPDAPGNRDWQDYQTWLAAGNTPDPEFSQAELDAQAAAAAKDAAAAYLQQTDLDISAYNDAMAMGRPPRITVYKYQNILKKRAQAQKTIMISA